MGVYHESTIDIDANKYESGQTGLNHLGFLVENIKHSLGFNEFVHFIALCVLYTLDIMNDN